MSRLLISNNKVINISTLINNFIGTGYMINYQIFDNCFRVEYHDMALFFTYDELYGILTKHGYLSGIELIKRRVFNVYRKYNY
jgi:hypothetical protein